MRALGSIVLLCAAVFVDTAVPGAAPPAEAVTYVASDKVAEAFTKGMPLVETAAYKVHASRREAPGMAEVHTRDTDIIYVLDGTAMLVTGGDVVDGRTTAPDEIRGAAIRGGQPRRLARGDLMIIPNGTPHWFTEIQGPFLYYVVKVTAPGGEAL